MEKQQEFDTLLNFFKVLAHESRLKILGLLAEQEYSVSELADLLVLKDPTISHHLAKLTELGLVAMRQDGTTHYYRLNVKALQQLNKEILTPENVASLADTVPAKDEDSRVLRSYVNGETLKQIPLTYKKKLVILRWLVEKFEDGMRYPEKQVNEIIKQHHPDFATLRRDLVDNKFMQRENSIYWRLPKEVTEEQIARLMKGNVS